MLKILLARLQQYITENFQVYKLELAKAELSEKLPTFVESKKRQRNFKK